MGRTEPKAFRVHLATTAQTAHRVSRESKATRATPVRKASKAFLAQTEQQVRKGTLVRKVFRA